MADQFRLAILRARDRASQNEIRVSPQSWQDVEVVLVLRGRVACY